MEALDGLFRDPDTVYNVVSKAILSEQAKVDILNHNSIGNGMYAKSKDERIYGEKCVWDKCLTESCLHLNQQQKLLKKLEGKLITMKEDRSLMQRISYISKATRNQFINVYWKV